MPKLTAKSLEALAPPERGRIELVDTEARGLRYRLTAAGVASWSLQVNVHGEKRRFSIGEYPAVGLAKAREEARRLRAGALGGADPIRERRAAKVQKATELTVEEALVTYRALHLSGLRTGVERERQLRAALASRLSRPVASLTRREVQAMVDAKASEGRSIAANRVRAALSHFTNWAFQRGYMPEPVGKATARPTRERPRERVLSLAEIRDVFDVADMLGAPWAPYFRLLMLTAQRRGDLAGATWPEVDLQARRWTVPGSRTKNGKGHVVHLSEPAAAIFAELRTEAGGDDARGLVFTTTGRSPISGFSRAKIRLDQALAKRALKAAEARGRDPEPAETWRLHDFRTAFASHMADAGESEGVVDRVLNHVASASSASAVARVYNRAGLLSQRARVLDRWAEMIRGERGVVTELRA